MFINPKVAIENGWITGIRDTKKQVQPNAVDFTIDNIQYLIGGSVARISEEEKVMRDLAPVNLLQGKWMLNSNCVYDGTSEMFVDVPEGVAAVLWTRSTFARNGVFIMSGLYDSGYKGHIGFTIYTPGGMIEIAPRTRIGQIGFFYADSAGKYAGGWNHGQGTHYTEAAPRMPSAVAQDQTSNKAFSGPQLMEKPIGSNPNKSEIAQDLEDSHKWDSDQGGKPAGTKNFI